MSGADFTSISAKYDQRGIVQRAASERLFDLLGVRGGDNVLDLGCGTGSLTKRIRGMTTGRVVGLDPAEGMIEKAKAACQGEDIEFVTGRADQMSYDSEFELIFCNSTFQWFKDPAPALAGCLRALRPGGRMGIQAPATSRYCPQFVEAVSLVASAPQTKDIYARFSHPWFFLEDTESYRRLFENAGFAVKFAALEKTVTINSGQEVMGIFESGAAAGYLNPACYGGALDDGYIQDFRRIVRGHFNQLAAAGNGKLELEFTRIYLVAAKPAGE